MANLKKITSTAWGRGFALAKLSARASAQVAGHALGNWLAAEDTTGERLKSLLSAQARLFATELGKLKGSVMKAGQMLSVYGEHFLPPEVNAILKTLQNQSPPVEWAVIEAVLLKELGPDRMALLEIDPTAAASASLGQVHRAKVRATGIELALKVQYPGVEQAIDSDLRTLKALLSVTKLIPTGPRYEQLFDEVRIMLHQEVDYRQELTSMKRFREWLKGDARYIIPEPFEEFSTGRVLATAWQGGVAVDGPEVKALPPERRNRIAHLVIDLYFRELYVWGEMQTDPHFGNYRIQLGSDHECVVLFDFGAVRKFGPEFLIPYRAMITAAHRREETKLVQAAVAIHFLRPEDPDEYRKAFVEFCYLIIEPFSRAPANGMPAGSERKLFDADGAYDWAESDLPMRIARQGKQLALLFKLRAPPQEVVFLDRKMGGMFIFMYTLGARLRVREILEKYLNPAES